MMMTLKTKETDITIHKAHTSV